MKGGKEMKGRCREGEGEGRRLRGGEGRERGREGKEMKGRRGVGKERGREGDEGEVKGRRWF